MVTLEVATEPKRLPGAAGLPVDAIVDPAGLLKLKGDDGLLVAAADGAAAAAVAADVLPNENADGADPVVLAAVDVGTLKLNAEAGEAAAAGAAAAAADEV